MTEVIIILNFVITFFRSTTGFDGTVFSPATHEQRSNTTSYFIISRRSRNDIRIANGCGGRGGYRASCGVLPRPPQCLVTLGWYYDWWASGCYGRNDGRGSSVNIGQKEKETEATQVIFF